MSWLLLALACTGKADDTGEVLTEGRNPGECADGADNDGDGAYDCDDPDCAGSPDCEDPVDSGNGGSSDSDSAPVTEDTSEDIGKDAEEGAAHEIEEARKQTWSDAGGDIVHYLPFEQGVHMGASQGIDCGSHAGSLEGSIDFNIQGTYESSHLLYAAASAWGTVIWSGDKSDGYGNYVILRHADGTFSLYAHLKEIYVSDDEEVCAGSPLGLIGTTGNSSGEHLHYEQRDSAGARVKAPAFDDLASVPSSPDCSCTIYDHKSGCYESANEVLCVGCVGEITDASTTGMSVDVTGYVQSDHDVHKWSLVVDEDTVESETPDSSYATVSAELDLSGDFDPGSHTLALWCEDGTGYADLVDYVTISLSEEQSCDTHAAYQCSGGDVYWYDSCGTQEDIKLECASDEACVETSDTTAECSAECGDGDVDSGEECDGSDLDGETCETLGYDDGELGCNDCSFDESACCTDESSYQCSSGDVYWYDSCGDRGSVHTTCESDETCVDLSSTTAECQCGESDYWSPDSLTDSDEGAAADGSTYGTGNGTTLTVEMRDDGTGDVEFQVCKSSGSFSGSDIWVVFDEEELGAGVIFEAAVGTSSASSCTNWESIDTSSWSEGEDFGGDMHIESPSSSEATWGSGCSDDGDTTGDCWFFGSLDAMERTCL